MAISDIQFTNNFGKPLMSVALQRQTKEPTRAQFIDLVVNFEGDDIIAYLDTIRINWIQSEVGDVDDEDKELMTLKAAIDYDQNHSPQGTNREMIKCFGVIEQSSLAECLIAFAKWGIYFIRTNHLNDAAFLTLLWHGFTRTPTDNDQRSTCPAMVDDIISVVGPANFSGTPSSICPVNEIIDMGTQCMPLDLDASLYGRCHYDRDSTIPAPTFVAH